MLSICTVTTGHWNSKAKMTTLDYGFIFVTRFQKCADGRGGCRTRSPFLLFLLLVFIKKDFGYNAESVNIKKIHIPLKKSEHTNAVICDAHRTPSQL